MPIKQLKGSYAPDQARYSCITDGVGNLPAFTVVPAVGIKRNGIRASDGSRYITLTDGNGDLQ